MMIGTIDESQRAAARVAGFAYLLTFVIVVLVNFGIHERLMVAGNAAETARNILAHERLFRIGVAGELVYEAGLVVLLSALYVILKPVGRTVALLAAFWRLVKGFVDQTLRSPKGGHASALPVLGKSSLASCGGKWPLSGFEERISTEFPKCRAFLQALWETLLVSRQSRTHQVMHGGVTEEMHLLHRLFCGPTLSVHAICRDHHSGPVIA